MHHRVPIAALTLLLVGCRAEAVDESLRRGQQEDATALPATQQANVYAAALRAAFDLPGTTLLVDPRMLAAEGGYAADGARMSEEVTSALVATRTIQGECVPEDVGVDRAPACPARSSGYAVRFSDVFDAAGDTVRVHLVAERYRPATDTVGYHSVFRMEERYHLVRNGAQWRVTRKERMRL